MGTTTQSKIIFTDNELRHIALNAMGRASEAGTEPVFRLGFAANIVDGVPSNNSGYTLGYMQVDYGAQTDFKKNITDKVEGFIDAYNIWATEHNKTQITDRNEAIFLLAQSKSNIKDYNAKYPDNTKVFQDIRSTEFGKNILCTRQKKKLAELVCIIWIFAKTRPCTTSTSYTAF